MEKRFATVLLVLGSVLISNAGWGQSSAAAAGRTFDAITIKPSGRAFTEGGAWGVSQNVYRAKNTPLSRVILQAYLGALPVPESRLKDAPGWVLTEPYDITAKADDATADLWNGLPQAKKVAVAAPLLRAMLEERCKLVAHTVPVEVDGYALVVAKSGLKMKQAAEDEELPAHSARFEGGWGMVSPMMKGSDAGRTVTYLKVEMEQFTQFISMGSKPIVDQTGLTGKWDFEVPLAVDPNPPAPAEGEAPVPRPDVAHLYDWKAVGLELRPIKVPAQELVIDHIERPTPN